MRKYGLLLMVLVLASASLLAAAAFNAATVTSHASMTVVNTNEALLTLRKGTGTLDAVFDVNGGEMYLDFDKGYGGGSFGLQPHSEYFWKELFIVTNNTNDSVKFKVELYDASGNTIPNTANVKVTISSYLDEKWFVVDNVNQGNWWGPEVFTNKPINVRIKVEHATSLGNRNYLVKVVATQ